MVAGSASSSLFRAHGPTPDGWVSPFAPQGATATGVIPRASNVSVSPRPRAAMRGSSVAACSGSSSALPREQLLSSRIVAVTVATAANAGRGDGCVMPGLRGIDSYRRLAYPKVPLVPQGRGEQVTADFGLRGQPRH